MHEYRKSKKTYKTHARTPLLARREVVTYATRTRTLHTYTHRSWEHPHKQFKTARCLLRISTFPREHCIYCLQIEFKNGKNVYREYECYLGDTGITSCIKHTRCVHHVVTTLLYVRHHNSVTTCLPGKVF